MNFIFESFTDLFLVIKVYGYKPARPAPACNNPDSPLFSDCGDDAEWDSVDFYYFIDNKEYQIKDEEFCLYLEDILIDEIITVGESKCTS
jgi:hypothetical protein